MGFNSAFNGLNAVVCFSYACVGVRKKSRNEFTKIGN